MKRIICFVSWTIVFMIGAFAQKSYDELDHLIRNGDTLVSEKIMDSTIYVIFTENYAPPGSVFSNGEDVQTGRIEEHKVYYQYTNLLTLPPILSDITDEEIEKLSMHEKIRRLCTWEGRYFSLFSEGYVMAFYFSENWQLRLNIEKYVLVPTIYTALILISVFCLILYSFILGKDKKKAVKILLVPYVLVIIFFVFFKYGGENNEDMNALLRFSTWITWTNIFILLSLFAITFWRKIAGFFYGSYVVIRFFFCFK